MANTIFTTVWLPLTDEIIQLINNLPYVLDRSFTLTQPASAYILIGKKSIYIDVELALAHISCVPEDPPIIVETFLSILTLAPNLETATIMLKAETEGFKNETTDTSI